MTFTGVINAGGRGWLTGVLAVLALSAVAFAAPGASAAGNITVIQSAEIGGSPADVWKVVGKFDHLQDWHPAVQSTTMNGAPTQPGSQRILHLKGGGDIDEQLTSFSDSSMRMTYEILKGPLPVVGYESFIAVTDAGGGKSLLIWGSTFGAAKGVPNAKAKEVIEGVYKAGLDTLKAKFGK
jgi:mxaD protein